MKSLKSINDLRNALRTERNNGARIGLVPTMGSLHAGHLSLVREATANCDIVVSTIFVNPLQFGENEDLAAYPRSFEEDTKLLNNAGCHYLFAPDNNEIYGDSRSFQTRIHVANLSDMLCGRSRPGHFDGVATVVCKLFNIIQPQQAYFGLKDYQQFLIIKQLVSDLNMSIEVIGVEIVREQNGLALSSRNHYLSTGHLETASEIYRTLVKAKEQVLAGNRDFKLIEEESSTRLNSAGLETDYFSICRSEDLAPAKANDTSIAILVAAYLESTRLIDNLRFELL